MVGRTFIPKKTLQTGPALFIEELGGGSNVKQAIRKVWVQMTRLSSELRDFLNIWIVGTILGVTKDVDMIFTRQYNRARMQVLVLDPHSFLSQLMW
jgi:hypothetical protein